MAETSQPVFSFGQRSGEEICGVANCAIRKHHKNTKRIPREYEENTKATH
jgi:uncharacterized protein YoaH (UPF0181 family)